MKQFQIFELRSRGYSQNEVATMIGASRSSVSMIERRARGRIELARQTLHIREIAKRRQHVVRIKVGTHLQQIPMIILQRADRFQVHLQPNMVKILEMIKKNKQNCLVGGRTTNALVFSFDERGKLSLA